MAFHGTQPPFSRSRAAIVLLAARAAVGVALVVTLLPVTVDDYFRVFHAAWWWRNPGFTSSYDWLPGYLYVYGPLVGLSGDTVLAPRLLTLVLHLAAGAALAWRRGDDPRAGWLAAAWLLCAPLWIVLGTLPLSEALCALLLLGGILALERFLSHRGPGMLLLASVFYLAAATVRYEVWLLLPVFAIFALARRCERIGGPVRAVLALLPLVFPLTWMLLLWGAKGEPLSFLAIVGEDHFGRGDLLAELATPGGAVIALQAAAGIAAAILGVARAVCGDRRATDLLWEAHLLAAAVVVAIVLGRGDVPSQYPSRVLMPVILYSAVPVGRRIAAALPGARAPAVGALLGALLATAGIAHVFSLPGRVSESAYAAGRYLDEMYESGRLDPREHVVIDHDLPQSAAVLVYSGRVETVHVDALGDICSPKMICAYDSNCPLPEWIGSVRTAVVRKPYSRAYLEWLEWRVEAQLGDWTVYRRPRGAKPLATRFPGQDPQRRDSSSP
ncbi:MAG: hypothetical protein R6V85_01235 [Polyangia bacterium]